MQYVVKKQIIEVLKTADYYTDIIVDINDVTQMGVTAGCRGIISNKSTDKFCYIDTVGFTDLVVYVSRSNVPTITHIPEPIVFGFTKIVPLKDLVTTVYQCIAPLDE